MTPNAKQTYMRLMPKREPYLERARACAALTLPGLFPAEGHTGENSNPNPNQTFGARAVNVLSSKMLIGLFPANVPIFKRSLSKADQLELSQNNPDALKEIMRTLGMVEMEATSEMEAKGWRPVLHADMRNKIVGGNYLLHIQEDGTLRGFNLTQYVTRRDPSGNHMETVVEEEVDLKAIPEPTLEAIKPELQQDQKRVKIYTHIYREMSGFKVYQEVKDVVVDGSEGSYPLDRCPWIPGRWVAQEGEDYGRSMVEDYFGDLNALDVISKAIREYTAIASKTVFLNRPGGLTRARDVTKARNGDVIPGRLEDLQALRIEKQADFQTAVAFVERIENRLGHAFLMNSAVQRNGERVTLGEVRFMISELNDALGGVYAVQATELQSPLVRIHLHNMEKQRRLPKLPAEGVKTTIVTGLEALSREHDLQNIQQAFAAIGSIYGPEAIATFTNPENIITRIFTNLRIDPDGALKDAEQVRAEQQQAQMQQLVQQFGPEVMKLVNQNPQGQGTNNG